MNQFSKLIFISLFIVGISTSLCGQKKWNKYSVALGSKSVNSVITEKPMNCRSLAVRMDGDGNYYPEFKIADKSMKKSKGKLETWYKKHNREFDSIRAFYQVVPDSNAFKMLNEKIVARYVSIIDSLAEKRDIVLLIHGYRKKMYGKTDNAHSLEDNQYVETFLDSNKLFIEVYWDSKYISLLKGVMGKKGFRMMEESAMQNAQRVGIQLRLLVDAIGKNKLAVISHSLGAIVANYLTFNYEEDTDIMRNKEIRAAYLAPAIGYESFYFYNARSRSNYTLKSCIGYNERDYVLLKDFEKFGIKLDVNPCTYGNTSLGCNYLGEIDHLVRFFHDEIPQEIVPETIDMGPSIRHFFPGYARHPSFEKVKHFLFE